MPELNGGVWATTGILAVYALELVLGSPSRAYYLVTSLAIVATVLVSWRLYHSLLLSALIGLCFALTTYDYVSYALSGGMIFPLVITFAVFYFYCQYELFRESDRSWLWWPLFAVSCCSTRCRMRGGSTRSCFNGSYIPSWLICSTVEATAPECSGPSASCWPCRWLPRLTSS